MKCEEYVKTIVCNGVMINIGLDDAGQQYFLEYVNDSGELVEVGCGSYNTDYMEVVESYWGDPATCEHYGLGICEDHVYDHGYCHKCPYNIGVINRNIRMKNRK